MNQIKSVSCEEVVNKLIDAKTNCNTDPWWKNTVQFDWKNIRGALAPSIIKSTQTNASWIAIQFNLTGTFKTYSFIFRGEKIYGNVKPFLSDEDKKDAKGRDSKDKVQIQIAKSREMIPSDIDDTFVFNESELSWFFKFMELVNEVFTGEMEIWNNRSIDLMKTVNKIKQPMSVDEFVQYIKANAEIDLLNDPVILEDKYKKNFPKFTTQQARLPNTLIFVKNTKVFGMIQDMAGDQKITNPIARMNIKYYINGKSSCESIFDRKSAVKDKKTGKVTMQEIFIDDKPPTSENIHKTLQSRTTIYGTFNLSGATISQMGISCSAVIKNLYIELPEHTTDVDVADVCGIEDSDDDIDFS